MIQPLITTPDASMPCNLRAKLLDLTIKELLGPAGGPDEVVTEDRVSNRYAIGMLYPKGEQLDMEGAETLTDATPDSEDGRPPSKAPGVAMMQPASIGLTFAVEKPVTELEVTASWGHYLRTRLDPDQAPDPDNKLVWQRRPRTGTIRLPIKPGVISPISFDSEQPDVIVRGTVRDRDGALMVSLFLVNGQLPSPRLNDQNIVFQPELVVCDPQGAAIFIERPLPDQLKGVDQDDRAMRLLYRRTIEFAVGHGVAAQAELAPGDWRRAVRLRTVVAPDFEVERMDPPDAAEMPGLAEIVMDMRTLAETPDAGFAAALTPLATAYESWISAQEARVTASEADLAAFKIEARANLKEGRRALERIRAGITLLGADPQAAKAFRFANRAMWLQRVRTLFSRAVRQNPDPEPRLEDFDQAPNRSWRPFQLAFVLLNLPSLANPAHPERTSETEALTDLLWFPTGGGKTEAYLGVTAFAIGIRRLQGATADTPRGGDGIAVLMRYTLRLLTLQQFQRAAALICACDVIRREDPQTWGTTPIRIGLWVGERSTPNWTEDSARAVNAYRQNQPPPGGGTPYQLTTCPWCGKPIGPGTNIVVETFASGRGRTIQHCSDPLGQCAFSRRQSGDEGLPIVVVDEEIYRLLPALLIATVDKFAQMPWRGETQALFGRVSGYCPRHGYTTPDLKDSERHPAKGSWPAVKQEPVPHGLRPPDLIIQDELHLISGPLGTLVGLYETAVDELCTWRQGEVAIRPKVIASTATIRRARQQVNGIFLRKVAIFPPPALDADDSFFARRRAASDASPGRIYLGLCASGARVRSFMIRVYTALMAAAQTLYEQQGRAADPWMTTIGYFNSLRELGAARRAIEDSVREQLRRMDERGLRTRLLSRIEELTSRKSARDIPQILDRLEAVFDPDAIEARSAARKAKEDTQTLGQDPYDVVLATNMISVGVDVSRLGLMVVTGQPKATAEYIQATSRVGRDRSGPGLVVTIYNWTRPRDLSHYERFGHYHATFYEQVEALSVTPFSRRALDRALSGVLTSLIRLDGPRFNGNTTAGELDRSAETVKRALAALRQRAGQVTADKEIAALVGDMSQKRLDEWLARAATVAQAGGQLGYEEAGGNIPALLARTPSTELFTALGSLRDVEPMASLILDDYGMTPRAALTPSAPSPIDAEPTGGNA